MENFNWNCSIFTVVRVTALCGARCVCVCAASISLSHTHSLDSFTHRLDQAQKRDCFLSTGAQQPCAGLSGDVNVRRRRRRSKLKTNRAELQKMRVCVRRYYIIATPAPSDGVWWNNLLRYVLYVSRQEERERERKASLLFRSFGAATGRNHPDSAECKFGCRAQSGLECVVEYAFRDKSCLRIMFPATLTRRFIIHSAG